MSCDLIDVRFTIIIYLIFIASLVHAHEHDEVLDEAQITNGCEQAGYTEKVTASQQNIINSIFARPEHRLHHSLWHTVRTALTPSQLRQITAAYGMAWGDVHPVCPPPRNNPEAPSYNPAGEDFLFMHHQMVLLLEQNLLSTPGMKCIAGWTSIPDPKRWPLVGALRNSKSAKAYALLKRWDAIIQNTEWLRSVSLSQLGWVIEYTIHNNLHLRYATDRPAPAFRSDGSRPDGAALPLDGQFPEDWPYNSLAYNWLADPYASAINPHFWKIHGYVDHLLALWLAANGKSRVAVDCAGDKLCYQWRGTWTGNVPELKDFAVATSNPLNSDAIDFNRRRMKAQRLGMILDSDFTHGRGKSPINLLETTRAIICPKD